MPQQATMVEQTGLRGKRCWTWKSMNDIKFNELDEGVVTSVVGRGSGHLSGGSCHWKLVRDWKDCLRKRCGML